MPNFFVEREVKTLVGNEADAFWKGNKDSLIDGKVTECYEILRFWYLQLIVM